VNLWEKAEYVNKKGETVQTERAIRVKVSEMTENINRKVISRGTRAVNAIRSAELRILKGQRSGKVYRKPYTKATYTASAPGESPARRTGNLRLHWNGQVKADSVMDGGVTVIAQLESQEAYAGALEYGTKKIAPRPFVEKIQKEAEPEIRKIYSEPYT